MPSVSGALISVDYGPFPVAVIDRATAIKHANTSWRAVADAEGFAYDALGLFDADRDDFVDTVRQVADDRTHAWVDIDAHVLVENRWARCHIWPDRNSDAIIAAVVPLREIRTTEMSRAEIDHLERILEHTADAITIVDSDMSFKFASRVATRWLGMSGANYEGHPALNFVCADDQHIVIGAFAQCLETPRRSVKARFRVVHESGDLIWVEGIGTNMFDDPAIQGILVTLNDITELVETRNAAEAAEAALDAQKKRYETLGQFIPTGVFELDAENRLTFCNERFEQLTGLGVNAEFSNEIFDERDRDSLTAALKRTRAGGTTLTEVRLARNDRADGPQWVTIRAVCQAGCRILASLEDATLPITKQAELAHRVDHDSLTGLPNRDNLLVQLNSLIATGEPIAVLFIDLDNFKDINDGLGHQVGDAVLIEIADRIQAVVRPTDLVGRLHGDEFLVVCRHTSDIATAHDVAMRIVAAVGDPLDAAAQGLLVASSVGIAMNDGSDPADTTPEQLLVAADLAMYEAKRQGGSRAVPFNLDLGRRAADRLRLHGDVQRASELDELEVHYQPIVELASGVTVGAEALVRWQHPTQGFILPARFIPEIEKSELIDQLGMWVIEKVIASLADAGPDRLPVNVNVSPRQLSTESFARSTLKLLHDYEVPGPLLTVEITELVPMADFSQVEQQLRQLQRHGVGIAIDDFGTGYSALAYLRRFPFDQVKIDGAFIDQIDSSPSDRAIVKSVIDLVTSLGATPIAEKVEHQHQADVLIELGCPYAQGYLLGRPRPLATTI